MNQSVPRRSAVAALGLAVAVFLGACSGSGGDTSPVQIDPRPQAVQETLPAAEGDDLWLPYQFNSLALVDPAWESATVEQRGGLFAAMRSEGEALTFSVTDSEGTTLWRAQRAAADTEFALATTPEGRDVAVLTDSTGTLTASAYDLADGERIWGPVEVPGPLRGPGLVFAPAGPEAQTSPEAVALSVTTGTVVTAQDLGAQRILGEYGGVVLTLASGAVHATQLGGDGPGENLWQLSLAHQGWQQETLTAPSSIHPGADLAVLNTAPSSATSSGAVQGALVDLTSGKVLAEDVTDVLTESATGTIVYLTPGRLHGLNRDSDASWQAEVGSSARMTAAGGALVYLRDGETIRAYNVLTGDVAEAYDPQGSGTLTVPEIIAPSGGALLRAGDQRYLATTLPGEGADLTGQG